MDKDGLRSDSTSFSSKTIHFNGHGHGHARISSSSCDAYMNMSNLPAKSQEQCGQLLERTDELKHREEHAQRRTGKAQSKQKDSLTEMFIVTILAPRKSEGICSFLHNDNFVTSHAERFLLSTHGGECLQMTPTITTDWVGQMYPTGFLVIDNNLAYIEGEDELDQVVDDWNDAPENTEYCQDISNTSPKQNECELELAFDECPY